MLTCQKYFKQGHSYPASSVSLALLSPGLLPPGHLYRALEALTQPVVCSLSYQKPLVYTLPDKPSGVS